MMNDERRRLAEAIEKVSPETIERARGFLLRYGGCVSGIATSALAIFIEEIRREEREKMDGGE
jgi:hypothetical protein